jgi:hypothetical protein
MSTLPIRVRTPFAANWIISGREDLTWFIGSSLISYAVLVLMKTGFPLTPLALVWMLGIDGPHVLATVTRTYCDNNERRRLGGLIWVVLPAMMVGPVMVAGGAEPLFYVFAISWLHYHIAKQHFGFLMLYRHKARERNRTDFLLERAFLMGSLMLPFSRYIIRSSFPLLAALPIVHSLETALLAAYAATAIVFGVRQWNLWNSGAALNVPKLMLMAAVVPLQWLAFGYAAAAGPDGVVRAGIVLGLFHSFQYHRLMWFHNRNRYSGPQQESNAGIAVTLARRFAYYFGAAVLLNLILQVLPSHWIPNSYVRAALWGIPFTHYILDSKIWRVRGNKELAAALKL